MGRICKSPFDSILYQHSATSLPNVITVGRCTSKLLWAKISVVFWDTVYIGLWCDQCIVTFQASYQLTACTFRNSGILHGDSFNKCSWHFTAVIRRHPFQLICWVRDCSKNRIFGFRNRQEAQLSPRDRAMRRVSWNLANCHATVQYDKSWTNRSYEVGGLRWADM